MKGAARRWLFLGEGTFSFSSALCKKLNLSSTHDVVATCYYDEHKSISVFGDALAKNVSLLQDMGVSVAYGVDATNLHSSHTVMHFAPYDAVFFWFPNVDQKGRMDLARDLLQKTCISVSNVLAEREGIFFVSLTAGQGGTQWELPQYRRAPGDAWDICRLASHGELFLKKASPLAEHFFGQVEGYIPCGRRGTMSTFRTEGAIVHELVKRPKKREDDETFFSSCQMLSYFPRDVSFWLPDMSDHVNSDGDKEENVEESRKKKEEKKKLFVASVMDWLSVSFCDPLVGMVENVVLHDDSYTCPSDGRSSVTLRMQLRGFISPNEAAKLQANVANALADRFNVKIR